MQYLHSDIDTMERVEIMRNLRIGKFDVLVGINLLREGLDIPECSLVAILDADKEGFLRSQTALIQTIGRAARNIDGTVIMYGDVLTKSIDFAVKETERRKKIQHEYNLLHGITPQSVIKSIQNSLYQPESMDYIEIALPDNRGSIGLSEKALPKEIEKLEMMMKKAAKDMEFEKAADLRDRIVLLKKKQMGLKVPS